MSCCDKSPHEPDRAFYVSVVDAGRTGLLLGPYLTHEEALENVDRGRKLAQERNRWADFYGFGTLSIPANSPSPRTVFGK